MNNYNIRKIEFKDDAAEYWVVEDAKGEVLGGAGFYPTEGLPSGMAEVVTIMPSSIASAMPRIPTTPAR